MLLVPSFLTLLPLRSLLCLCYPARSADFDILYDDALKYTSCFIMTSMVLGKQSL